MTWSLLRRGKRGRGSRGGNGSRARARARARARTKSKRAKGKRRSCSGRRKLCGKLNILRNERQNS